jgi:Fic family protein
MKNKLINADKKLFNLLIEEATPQLRDEVISEAIIKNTFNSIKFQGNNKITLEQAKELYLSGDTLNITLREKTEALNYFNAIKFLQNLLKEKQELTQDKLKDLHEILVKDTSSSGGTYRSTNISIFGAEHQPPNYIKVYDRMNKLFEFISTFEGDPINLAVYVHATISKVHPFLDGNGRLSRLVLSYFLSKAGFIPVDIKLDRKARYFELLDVFKVDKNINPLNDFIKDTLIEQYDELIDKLEK